MNEYFGTGRCHWGAIEVDGAKDEFLCRELWVDVCGAHEIESDKGLWEKFVPEMDGEVGICTAKSSSGWLWQCAWGGTKSKVAGIHCIAPSSE
jgi:hypothetical protein